MAGRELDSPVVAIEGRACRVARLRLGDYRELERRFAAARPDPLSCVREWLREWPESLQRQLLELAFEAMLRPAAPTIEELRCWLVTVDGLSAALELSLREAVPHVPAEPCRRVVYEAEGSSREELLRVIEFAVGMRLIGEGDSGNERSRGAAASASAADEPAEEPDWIGRLCATD